MSIHRSRPPARFDVVVAIALVCEAAFAAAVASSTQQYGAAVICSLVAVAMFILALGEARHATPRRSVWWPVARVVLITGGGLVCLVLGAPAVLFITSAWSVPAKTAVLIALVLSLLGWLGVSVYASARVPTRFQY